MELLVCAVHPIPGRFYFLWTTKLSNHGGKIGSQWVPVDVTLSLPMFLRSDNPANVRNIPLAPAVPWYLRYLQFIFTPSAQHHDNDGWWFKSPYLMTITQKYFPHSSILLSLPILLFTHPISRLQTGSGGNGSFRSWKCNVLFTVQYDDDDVIISSCPGYTWSVEWCSSTANCSRTPAPGV